METAPENLAEISRIRGSMRCARDFVCCTCGLDHVGKVRLIANGDLLDCLEEDAGACRCALPFGGGFFCRCPLRKYLAKIFDV